jgi:hypothetical protein
MQSSTLEIFWIADLNFEFSNLIIQVLIKFRFIFNEI